MKSVPTVFSRAFFERVAGWYESLFFIIRFQFSFDQIHSLAVLLHGQILFHAGGSKLIFTFQHQRGRAISRDGSRMQIPNRLDWLQPGFNNSNQANAVFSIPPGEVINHFSLHSHVKFPSKLGFFPLIFTIHIHLICHMWPILVWHAAGLPSPPPSPPTHFPAPLLWANLSDLSPPRAFSSVCPSWTLSYRSPSGGIPHGTEWDLALCLIWHPQRGEGRGGRV